MKKTIGVLILAMIATTIVSAVCDDSQYHLGCTSEWECGNSGCVKIEVPIRPIDKIMPIGGSAFCYNDGTCDVCHPSWNPECKRYWENGTQYITPPVIIKDPDPVVTPEFSNVTLALAVVIGGLGIITIRRV